MTPDSDSSRLARLEQRVDDLAGLLSTFGATTTHVAMMGVKQDHYDEAVRGMRADVKELRDALDTRDAQMSKERKDTRIALWSLVGVLGAALISGGAAIVVALVGGG